MEDMGIRCAEMAVRNMGGRQSAGRAQALVPFFDYMSGGKPARKGVHPMVHLAAPSGTHDVQQRIVGSVNASAVACKIVYGNRAVKSSCLQLLKLTLNVYVVEQRSVVVAPVIQDRIFAAADFVPHIARPVERADHCVANEAG